MLPTYLSETDFDPDVVSNLNVFILPINSSGCCWALHSSMDPFETLFLSSNMCVHVFVPVFGLKVFSVTSVFLKAADISLNVEINSTAPSEACGAS